MFWLDHADDEHRIDSVQSAPPAPGHSTRRRMVGVLATLSVAVGAVVLIVAASEGHRGPKPAVLPAAPFVLHPATPGGRIALPAVPTRAATPLPNNRGAAGGDTVPRPCSPPARPLHLSIPRLCVDAPIVPSRAVAGQVSIPVDVHTVGVWTDGQPLTDAHGAVGRTGTTLIVGHVDDADQGNGALHDAYLIEPGEAVFVTDAAGHTARWRAIAMQVVLKSALPPSLFAGAHGPRRMQLVTCGGRLLHLPDGHGGTFGTYEDNVIVTLVPG